MADTILTDDADVRYSLDRIQTRGYLNGHLAGLTVAVDWLRERSVTLFRHGKDDLAKLVRGLADQMDLELRPSMAAATKKHDRNFPIVIEAE